MFGLLLCHARLVDDTVNDIVLKDDKIAALGDVDGPALRIIELGGECYVSTGWIDSHVHCYPRSPIYHDQPDNVGITTGVTTVVDAGSTGADGTDDLYTLTREAATEMYALLNISHVGLITQSELANMVNIDTDTVREVVERRPDFIVGLEARMSSSAVGENGITPPDRAEAVQAQNGDLPLMMHVGNNPLDLDEIAERLSAGDIIAHCYNGKPNRILASQGELWASVIRAISRGVRLGIRHDTTNLSFAVTKRAIELGILPHTTSSDTYRRNRINDPVHSLANVMSRFLAIEMSFLQVIECVITNATDGLRLKQRGRLQISLDADLTLFTLKRQPVVLVDAENDSLQAEQLLVPPAAIHAGKGYMTEQGGAEHTFDF